MTARWVLSPVDQRNHVIDQAHGLIGGVATRCGQPLSAMITVTASPAAGGAMCTTCAAALVTDAIGPPVHYAPRVTGQTGSAQAR